MQIQSNSVIQHAQGQRHVAAQTRNAGAKEKFDTRLRGSMGAPRGGPGGTGPISGNRARMIPAQFQNQPAPTFAPGYSQSGPISAPAGMQPADAAAAAPVGGSANAQSNPGAFASPGQDNINSIWYGEQPSGTYSEKASYGGQTGIGHPNYATTATGQDMVISVTGLHGKNPQPTRVMALDSNAVMQANGGVWPGTPAEMQKVLQSNPQCIVADVNASPPQMARITGIPPGTKVTMLVGAEGIMGNPPTTPPPSQAMITNVDQLSPKAQAMIPKEAIMAGGTEMMMKAAMEMAARNAAQAAAERAAQEAGQRFAAQSAANMAGAAAAERMGAAGQAGALAGAGGANSAVRGNPPVPFGGDVRGAQTGPTASPPQQSMDALQQATNASLGL